MNTTTPPPSVYPSASVKDFTPWKSGQPMTNELPKLDDDPWKMAFDDLFIPDSARCKAWKEEVENLLIFAGLFSGVVTAFLIESYKNLQQDPNELSAVLLLRIATRLEANGTIPAGQLDEAPFDFSPTLSNVRINTLWFLSLIISLTAVLIGTLCLQWLREHQQLPSNPEEAFPMLHMQIQTLDKSYVPHIFTMLPLLLQTGLIFFLVGIVDFLWHLNRTVASFILAAVVCVLTFYIITTILPVLQDFSLYLPRFPSSKLPRGPSPYRSPQSWAFLKLMGPVFKLVAKAVTTPLTWKRYWSSFSIDRNWFKRLPALDSASWRDHSEVWLQHRDLDIILCNGGYDIPVPLAISRPLYDSIVGLSGLRKPHRTREKLHPLLCFEKMISESTMLREMSHAHRFVLCLSYGVDLTNSKPFFYSSEEFNVLQDAAVYNNYLRKDIPVPKTVEPYVAEKAIRLLRSLFVEHSQQKRFHEYITSTLLREILFYANVPGFIDQLSFVAEEFFERASNLHKEDIEMNRDAGNLTFVFLTRLAMTLSSNFHDDTVRARHAAVISNAISIIRKALDSSLPAQRVAYLVITLSFYLDHMRRPKIDPAAFANAMKEARPLLLLFKQYRVRCFLSGGEIEYFQSLEKRFYASAGFRMGYNWRKYVDGSQDYVEGDDDYDDWALSGESTDVDKELGTHPTCEAFTASPEPTSREPRLEQVRVVEYDHDLDSRVAGRL